MNKPRNIQPNPIDLNDPRLHEDSPEFNDAIDRDFGSATDHHEDGFSRRRWLQLMGASLALGGLSGCRYQEEKIAPFAFRPQNRIPGVPVKFASLIEMGGVAEPILSTNYDGRPIKLDGNPNHPDSMGASSTYTQARILEFYDPDRLRAPLFADGSADAKKGPSLKETTWEDLLSSCKLPENLSSVAILSEPTSSPSLMRLQSEFTKKGGSWFSFTPISDDNTRAGSKLAFGTPHRAHYAFDKAKVIVTIDADPLRFESGSLANSVSFAKGRDSDRNKMSRMYSVESQYTTTGASADHRISVPSTKIPGFAAALAQQVKDRIANDNNLEIDASLPYREKVLAAMASDLVKYRGEGVIVAGERQAPEVHALVHNLNQLLDNNGKTVTFTKLPDPDRPSTLDSIKEFASQLESGEIKTVILLGGNPVFDAPRSLNLGDLIKQVENSVHISVYKNETSEVCKWVSEMAHPLESWKDGFSNNGSLLIGQPLINPLFGGKSDLEQLAILMGLSETSGQAIVRETVQLSESDWRKAVHDGFVEGTGGEAVTLTAAEAPSIAADDSWCKPWDGSSLEVVFAPSLSLYDGRFANNAWLQELPDFFTKISWDNVASVSPRTAVALDVHQRGMSSGSTATLMSLTVNGVTQNVPVVIQPGQADGSIGVEIGYGRKMAGRVGGDQEFGIDPIGHDIGDLRSTDNWLVAAVGKDSAKRTGTQYKLAVVQEPWAIDDTGRDEIQARMFRDYGKQESDRSALIREGTFASYQEFLKDHPTELETAESKPAPKRTHAVGINGALPILNQVSYVPDEKVAGGAAEDHADENHEGESGHGAHKPVWPVAFEHHMHHELFDLTPGSRLDYTQDNPAYTNVWGKSIDLNKCTGCNACVVACQAENNIPIVGKDGCLARSRDALDSHRSLLRR